MKQLGDYLLIKELGKGSFGEVFLTKKLKSPQLYATKKIPCSNLKSNEFTKYLNNEINIMKKLDHKNIVKLYDLIKTPNNLYIIMEYINGGNLLKYLSDYKLSHGAPFPQKMIQYFVKQIVDGLIHMHSKDILHRDMKLDNILLSFPPDIKKEDWDYTKAQIKIIDFGLSTQLRHYLTKDQDRKTQAESAVGTPMYMDPIILNKYDKHGGIKKFQLYDEKCDIWSLGAITYEMLTGQNLFIARDLPDLINQVKKGNYYLNVKDLSSEIISFLNCMLQYVPKKRLSAQELAKHQFLTKDPDKFTKADVSQIDYKIENGRLIVNIFNNNTIQGLFPFKPDDMLNSLTMNLDEISKPITKEKPIMPTNPIKQTNQIIQTNPIKQTNPNKQTNQIKQTNPIDTNINSRNNDKDIDHISNLKHMKTKVFISADIANLNIKNKDIPQNHLSKRTSKDLPIRKENLIKEEPKKYSSKNLQKSGFNKIKFRVEIIDNIKENVQVNIKFLVNKSNILMHKSDLNEKNGFKDEWTWEIDSNNLKNIDINDDYLMLNADIIKGNLKETISTNVDKISSGKAIGFKVKNNINFTLIPMF